MCQLLETIRIENGLPLNIAFHNQRFNHARNALYGAIDFLNLEELIHCPDDLKNDILKCRIIYSREVEEITFEPYHIRLINSLKLVNDNSIDYSYKYLDRSHLNLLREQLGNADDILIVKNGFISDTSYANIVFRHNDRWLTPSTPLLKGTKRENYLYSKKIIEELITPNDLHKFSEARIINAMINLENSPIIPIGNIHF